MENPVLENLAFLFRMNMYYIKFKKNIDSLYKMCMFAIV